MAAFVSWKTRSPPSGPNRVRSQLATATSKGLPWQRGRGRRGGPRPARHPGANQCHRRRPRVLRKSGEDALARAHQLKRRQEALELALKPLAAERDRVASQRTRAGVRHHQPGHRARRRAAPELPGAAPAGSPATAPRSIPPRPACSWIAWRWWRRTAARTGATCSQPLSTGQPHRATQGRLPRPWTLDVAPPPQLAAKAMSMAPASPAPVMRQRGNARPRPCPALTSAPSTRVLPLSLPCRSASPCPRTASASHWRWARSRPRPTCSPADRAGRGEAAYLARLRRRRRRTGCPAPWAMRGRRLCGHRAPDFNASAASTPGAATTSLSFACDELARRARPGAQDTTRTTGSRTERLRHAAATRWQKTATRPASTCRYCTPHRSRERKNRSRITLSAAAHQPKPGTSSKAPIAWQQPLAAGSWRSSVPSTPSVTGRTLSCWSAHEQYRAAAPYGAFSLAGHPAHFIALGFGAACRA